MNEFYVYALYERHVVRIMVMGGGEIMVFHGICCGMEYIEEGYV